MIPNVGPFQWKLDDSSFLWCCLPCEPRPSYSADEAWHFTIHMQAVKQCLLVPLAVFIMLYVVVLTFESVDEILWQFSLVVVLRYFRKKFCDFFSSVFVTVFTFKNNLSIELFLKDRNTFTRMLLVSHSISVEGLHLSRCVSNWKRGNLSEKRLVLFSHAL